MDSASPTAQRFAATRWSVVLAARQADSPQAREALATLCQTYWYPLYAFVRRQGCRPHDAQDLTQEFFARLIAKQYLAALHRERGKFRTFLLTAFTRFLANERDKARARKRGGGQTPISIDAAAAESRYGLEPSHGLTPEKIYEQRWALALLEQVMARLRQDYGSEGKAALFERISGSLSRPRGAVPYAEIAVQLATTEGAIKMAVYRLRGRYREVLREEIAQTVAGPAEVEEELRALFAAFNT